MPSLFLTHVFIWWSKESSATYFRVWKFSASSIRHSEVAPSTCINVSSVKEFLIWSIFSIPYTEDSVKSGHDFRKQSVSKTKTTIDLESQILALFKDLSFSLWRIYSSNKIRKTHLSTWTSFVKIWTVSNCEFNANFLTFWGLYHLLFALETIGVC